jgi:hypothetical protein
LPAAASLLVKVRSNRAATDAGLALEINAASVLGLLSESQSIIVSEIGLPASILLLLCHLHLPARPAVKSRCGTTRVRIPIPTPHAHAHVCPAGELRELLLPQR